MDVCDDFSQFTQAIEAQKRILHNAQKKKGLCPQDRLSRDAITLNFMMGLMATSARKESKETRQFHSSFIPEAYPPCIKPLDQLKPIAIRSLKLETHHRGSYLLVRAITPPNRMTGVLVLVEDERRDAVLLQLYQQEEEHTRAATNIVNEGTILIIKEPYFKVMASGDYGLRVDHLSDMIYLEIDDDRVPKAWRPRLIEIEESADTLKLKGNAFVGQGKHWEAIKEYSRALSRPATSQEVDIIRRNRSLAYLKTKQYDVALSDTGYPSFGKECSEKALFRAAEALYHLTRFEDCLEVLEKLCKNFPSNKQAVFVLEQTKRRCLEKSSGVYDFKLLQAEAKKLHPPHLDHATYIGPVEVGRTEHKGRGLFATEKMNAGDLILCEKAFAHAYVADGGNATLTFLMNIQANKGSMGGQADLMRMLVQKLYYNPSLAIAFTELHHGSYKATDTAFVDGQPVVDTFLVEHIMSLNVFGCPDTSLSSHKDAIANKEDKFNGFHSCGIWINASYINHSCMSNARRSFIGDMMVIRASKDLEAGTEIMFPYHFSTSSNMVDKQKKLQSWGFICDCTFCEDAKNTKASTMTERRKLEEKLKQTCTSSDIAKIQTKKTERLIDALNNTYTRSEEDVPRLLIWDPLLLLARIYMRRNEPIKGLQAVRKALHALGFVTVGADGTTADFRVVKWGHFVDHVVEMFLHLESAFEALQAWEKARQAGHYARTAYGVLVGEETSFDLVYPR